MRGAPWRVLCVALAAFALGGCSSETNGQATPADESGQRVPPSVSSAPVQSQGPGTGAPTVREPLDVQVLKQEPCGLLTDPQIRDLFGRVVRGEQRDFRLGSICSWGDTSPRPPGVLLDASFPDKTSLSALYKRREGLGLFQELEPIESHPVVIAMLNDKRDQGECNVDVGVNDQQTLTVQADVRGGRNPAANFDNPCGVAREAAEVMMRTVKARG